VADRGEERRVLGIATSAAGGSLVWLRLFKEKGEIVKSRELLPGIELGPGVRRHPLPLRKGSGSHCGGGKLQRSDCAVMAFLGGAAV